MTQTLLKTVSDATTRSMTQLAEASSQFTGHCLNKWCLCALWEFLRDMEVARVDLQARCLPLADRWDEIIMRECAAMISKNSKKLERREALYMSRLQPKCCSLFSSIPLAPWVRKETSRHSRETFLLPNISFHFKLTWNPPWGLGLGLSKPLVPLTHSINHNFLRVCTNWMHVCTNWFKTCVN